MKLNMFNLNGNYVVSPSATMDVVKPDGTMTILSPLKSSDQINLEQFTRELNPVNPWLILYRMAKNCGIPWNKRFPTDYGVYPFDRKDNPTNYDEFLELMCL